MLARGADWGSKTMWRRAGTGRTRIVRGRRGGGGEGRRRKTKGAELVMCALVVLVVTRGSDDRVWGTSGLGEGRHKKYSQSWWRRVVG